MYIALPAKHMVASIPDSLYKFLTMMEKKKENDCNIIKTIRNKKNQWGMMGQQCSTPQKPTNKTPSCHVSMIQNKKPKKTIRGTISRTSLMMQSPSVTFACCDSIIIDHFKHPHQDKHI